MRAPRGFTLAELLIGLVVTSIVMTAVVAAIIGVQGSYQREAELAQVMEKGRDALGFIERTVQMTGYGIDPRLGIDIANPPGLAARDNTTVTGFTYAATVTPVPVVVTDDLAYRYRDPAFLRRATFNGSSVTLTSGTFDVDIPVGKLLMVACPGAQNSIVVRTSAAPVGASINVSTVASEVAPFVNTNTSATCYSQGGALAPYVMIVHERRLRIVNIDNRPWLVSFRNLTENVTTSTNFDPLAPDVETFQVAFGMNRPPATGCCSAMNPPDNGGTHNKNFVVGDAATETVFGVPANLATSNPRYETSYNSADRYTAVPANVRQVHVALVVRGSRADPSGQRAFGQVSLFNWVNPGTGAADGFYRSTLHTIVETPNLASRSFFVPALRSSNDGTDTNTWGG
jgi:type IV pilus assembly protein PilW